ncbi:hypothetical protein [Microbacterium sp. PRC9]|uniref:hypothetical protein n=1 Tax=Microbacterium sp. PRC9 TaxID=2962591 RepID=UPI00288129FA|nr:hypothetical protein [Microbacterium sp. PRC9]MDT0141469.1 hypothetical protein [Microbacterium sp. PRC9]
MVRGDRGVVHLPSHHCRRYDVGGGQLDGPGGGRVHLRERPAALLPPRHHGATGRAYLHHHSAVGGGYTWTNITTSRAPGLVCGETTDFSPFALGHPLAPPDDGSVAPPAKGTLASDNGWDNGLRDSAYNIVWNLRTGENASIRLFENGVLVGEQALTYGGQAAQRATFPVANKPNGTYLYTAELENSRGSRRPHRCP